MTYKEGQQYFNFTLKYRRRLEKLNAEAYLWEHSRTKARVLSFKNSDKNKTFAIAFRTPPYDSTGLPHIMEHSVLSGSRKYPLKEAFAELTKRSLFTFLNALTFSDKTVYPCSSVNLKDYFNLMEVYLDSTFYPLLTKDTFRQEGWHYELDAKDKLPQYKGVVYNEMRGAFSSPLSILKRNMEKVLFPDTPYHHDSGGDPEFIPQLDYPTFVKYHQQYYHPSNCYVYFYGDAPLEQELQYLSENYLDHFSYLEINSAIPLNKTLNKPIEYIDYYPITPDESLKKKSYMSYATVIGNNLQRELQIAFDIIEYALLETPASPLTDNLLKANIAEDVEGSHSLDLLQPYIHVDLINTDPDHKDKFLEIYYNTLRKIVREGLDRDLVQAAINDVEFKLRELSSNTQRGLYYMIMSMNTWLYDASPLLGLRFEEELEEIKAKAGSGILEDLISQYLIDNPHKALISVQPDPQLAQKREAKLQEHLQIVKDSWSPEQLDACIRETRELKAQQGTPEDPQNIAKLPRLELSDIPGEIEITRPIIEKHEETDILTFEKFTKKIIYMDLMFDLGILPQNLLPYLPLFSNALLEMGTKSKDYKDFYKEIIIYTGELEVSYNILSQAANHHDFRPLMILHGEVLPQYWEKMLDIYDQLFKDVDFENRARLKELVMMEKSSLENAINNQGITFVDIRLNAYESMQGRLREKVSGLSAYYFYQELLKDFDSRADETIQSLKDIRELAFNRKNLTINLVTEAELMENLKTGLHQLLNSLSEDSRAVAFHDLLVPNGNQGLKTSSQVQYTGIGANLFDLGMKYSGSFEVLNNYLYSSYLWQHIRMIGGAYGCISKLNNLEGHYSIISYRDPNIDSTYKAFQGIPKMVSNLSIGQEELNNLIISSIGNIDKPLNPYQKGLKATLNHLSGRPPESINEIRNDILSTDLKKLRSYAPYFEQMLNRGFRCTLGNSQKIEAESHWFDEILPVF
ncbi:insulinase family protein [bacterium]|nr:insulinase family protein [bacterium]